MTNLPLKSPPTFQGNVTPLSDAFIIEKPLVIMFEDESNKVTCHIHPAEGMGHEAYGLIICDLVRHVARAFKVDEDDVWEWVMKERHHPTTKITNPS